MTGTTDKTQNRHVRILPEQWARVEKAALGTIKNPNEILVRLAMDALEQHELFGRDARIRVVRASLFTAQELAHGLIAEGHEQEVEEIREFISTIVPDPD